MTLLSYSRATFRVHFLKLKELEVYFQLYMILPCNRNYLFLTVIKNLRMRISCLHASAGDLQTL